MNLGRGWYVVPFVIGVVVGAIGCADTEGERGCDIRERECQKSVFERLTQLRGSAKQPRVRVVRESKLLAILREGTEEPDEAQRERANRFVRGLALLRLVPENYRLEDAPLDDLDGTAALYHPADQTVYVIDRGFPLDGFEADILLAHEYVHALQDAERGLAAYREQWAHDFDAALAIDGLLEGEATIYQLLVLADLSDRDPEHIDWGGLFESWQIDELAGSLQDGAPYIEASSRFAYAFGGGHVMGTWQRGGRKAVRALFDDPPQTTREILYGEGSFDLASERAAVASRATPLLDGLIPVSDTPLGAWLAGVFAAREAKSPRDGWTTTAEIASDIFSVSSDESGEHIVASWRLRAAADDRIQEWPGLEAEFARTLRPESEPREAVLIGSSADLPEDLGAIEWRASE